jgi:nanoRNase/pAp phosphatase (c-di-AMP/oligoRNAs hydrolase)
MELTPHEQIFEQIKKANRLLVALPESLSIDALASGLALKAFLEKQKKRCQPGKFRRSAGAVKIFARF